MCVSVNVCGGVCGGVCVCKCVSVCMCVCVSVYVPCRRSLVILRLSSWCLFSQLHGSVKFILAALECSGA